MLNNIYNLSMNLIYVLGNITWILIIFIAVSITTLLALALISLKTGKTIFPNLIILLISAFESPTQALLSFIGLEGDPLTRLGVQIRNKLNYTAFRETKYKDRLLLLPQCLRHATKCPAKITKNGIQCLKCGLCDVKKIMEKAEQLKYSVSIVPGGTFSARRIKELKPKAVVGVGCLFELEEGLNSCAKHKIPAIGVELETTGCINTKLDLKKLFEVMQAKTNDY